MHGCKPGAKLEGQKKEIGGSKAGIVECFVSVIGSEGSLGEKTPFSRSRLDRVCWNRGYMARVRGKELKVFFCIKRIKVINWAAITLRQENEG
jgi:hypothetical protein